MWLYFFAFFFVFLDFPITLPNGVASVNLMPDFVGYVLLFLARPTARHEGNSFRRLHLAALPIAALALAEFFLNLFGVALPLAVELPISILMTACALYVTYEYSEGVKDIQRCLFKRLGADKVASAWAFLCISSLLLFIVTFFPAASLPAYLLHWLAFAWLEGSIYHFNRRLSGRERPE